MSQPQPTGPKDRLGKAVERFYSDISQVVGGWVIGLMLLAGGAAWVGYFLWEALFATEQQANGTPGKALIASTFGLFMLAGGVGVLVYARWIGAHRVELCEGGVRVLRGRVHNEYPWREIRAVAETIILDRHRLFTSELANRAMPTYKDRRVELHLRVGEKVAFNDELVVKINRFCRVLRELAEKNEVPWATVEQDLT